ncbi:kinase-like protein [Athelia psychrophila]|uniref:Kinase-like protein n=1 Tax=Athelia psychrophila TaxID=1759441 RepID=A0A167WM63_9AGAM|nr:kinase-like protein [Fibularhizoctonia sp. CBS 109695]
MLSPTVVFNTTNTAGNAQINNVHHNYNIVYQETPDQVFKLIQHSIDRVEESREQFGFMAWTIAELLCVLNEGSAPGLPDLTLTSSTINSLQKLLEEIHDFIEAEGHESFVKSLVNKERRIAQIDAYQKKIAALANVFQVSALLDVAKWPMMNDAATVEDQNVLYARLDELERDRELLRNTLEAHQEGMAPIMIAFQKRLEQRLDGDRERQFFSKSVAYLQTASGRSVKIEDWMVTSFDVEFMLPIASGGFGEVFLGKWQQMEVALKVLRTERGIRASSKILQKEINVWSKLQHPHILPFLGANVWGDRPFIVMPYLKNGNARDYIDNYPECNRAAILHQTSLGLVYLHNKNIVHADLKGYNILIDDSGKAVLCDFGLSRVKTDINSRSTTAGDEEIYGSTNWMAPERLLGHPLRKPSDIYSFGMTIYEIFMNDVPLADVQRVDFTQLVARESVRPEKPSPDDGAPHLTDEIWALAERCWTQEPRNRPLANDICNSLVVLANPYVSDSIPPVFGTTSQILGTLATPEAGPSSGREGSARQEKDTPSVIDGRADIRLVPSVDVPTEIVAKGVEGKSTPLPERRQEEKTSEDTTLNALFMPGTWFTMPRLSSEKRRHDSQGSPLANQISTSRIKGSAPTKSASYPSLIRARTSKGARYVIVIGPTGSGKSNVRFLPLSTAFISSVIGPTGSGKSNFIWTASGEGQDRIQHGLAPVPADITTIECKHPIEAAGHPVIFVDTPGFENLETFEINGLHSLVTWLNTHIKKNNNVELAGIIFLHRISDNRMSGSLIRQLEILQGLCGMDVMKNVVVTTTMWEAGVSEPTAHRRQNELQTTWLNGMIEKGCKLEEFRGTKDSAWKSIDYLLNQKPCPPLLVQREMAGGMVFENTSAAKTAKRGFWRKLFSWLQ